MPESVPAVLFIGLVLAFAGFVKGVIGLGLPAIGVGLISLIYAPPEAAALLVIPNVTTNFWQMLAGRNLVGLLRRLWPLLAGIVLGSALGAWTFGGVASWAAALLGLALVAYGGLGLAALAPRWRGPGEGVLGAAAGVGTGVLTVITGVSVMPLVPYLNAIGLDRDQLVQALGLSFFVSTVGLAAALARSGILDSAVAGASALALVPVLAGMFAGQAVRQRVSQRGFRRWFFLGLSALGLYLVVRSLL